VSSKSANNSLVIFWKIESAVTIQKNGREQRLYLLDEFFDLSNEFTGAPKATTTNGLLCSA
jgi:hypothetical protein